MTVQRSRLWFYAGLVTLVALVAVVGVTAFRGKKPQTVSEIFCGPDGQLTSTAPIQSHRSYCLRALTAVKGLRPGAPMDFDFEIIDDRGETLTKFATVHEKIMHVIVVRHDLTQFQHLHPTFSTADGRFSVQRLVLPNDGPYRLFADFTPASGMLGPGGIPLPVTVPVDLDVGDRHAYGPQALPPASDSTTVGDYEITLARPDTLEAGAEAQLTFTIKRAGAPVEDLEPYLGANGHAVILREGDLEFIHSHALEDRIALRAGNLPFMVHFGEPGRYRMFVQFQHRGSVQTAVFTLPAVVGQASAGGGEHLGH